MEASDDEDEYYEDYEDKCRSHVLDTVYLTGNTNSHVEPLPLTIVLF